MNNIEKHLFKQFLIENKIRKKFLSYYNPSFFNLIKPCPIRKYLNDTSVEYVFTFAFYWGATIEKDAYWINICKKFINYCNNHK
jgi:hypothetical protein